MVMHEISYLQLIILKKGNCQLAEIRPQPNGARGHGEFSASISIVIEKSIHERDTMRLSIYHSND
jgi:hypothetical protein